MGEFLERLELRTNRAYWADGMLDLFCAAALLILGVSWVTKQAAFGGIAPALLVPLWGPFRRRFTEPRLGQVELAEERQHRNRAFMRLLLVAGALSLALGIAAYFAHTRDAELTRSVVKALPGGIVGIAAVAAAEALQLRRFFAYGAVTVAAALTVAAVEPLNPGWAFMAGGVCALVGGTSMRRHFVRRYPLQTEGAH